MAKAHSKSFHENTVKPCSDFYDISKRNRYRLCKVDGEEALFHGWSQEARVIEPSPMIGGHPGGQISVTWGIVEYLDGRVVRVVPEKVSFLDTSRHLPRKRK